VIYILSRISTEKASIIICLFGRNLIGIRDTLANPIACVQVGDAGVQWLVGSCYSPGLVELDLSGTDMTGNCFLRRMTALKVLRAEGCNSMSGQGVTNIAVSCPGLRVQFIFMSV
jgi:hypothetical protein